MDKQAVVLYEPLWTPSLLLDQDFDNEPLDLEYEHLAQRAEEDSRL